MKKQNISVLSLAKDSIIFNNPVFVQLLGTCPTLAITTTFKNGFSMGIAATLVLLFSNILISMLRNFISPKVRIASYVVIIAGLVTIVDLMIKAYFPAISQSLGLFIPLIVVNCIILARAESFAAFHNVFHSALDGLFTGVGFTFALCIISFVREFLGSGSIFGHRTLIRVFNPASLIVSPVGGFLALGFIIAAFNFALMKRRDKK